LEEDISDEAKQLIAREMNLAETAFVIPLKGNFQSSDTFGLRWFTPTMEYPLCGHATLGTAKVIYDVEKNTNVTYNIIHQ